jgi:hypothetical protein
VLLGLALALAVVASVALGGGRAGATTDPRRVRVQATPLAGLRDGQRVHVVVDVDQSLELFEVRARICRAGEPVADTWTYSADASTCPQVAFSGSAEPEASAIVGGGAHHGELDFQIGVGTVRWTDFDGNASSLTCGLGAPCQLVVQLQVTDDTVFWSTPLDYASSTQLDPPVPPTTRPIPDEDGVAPKATTTTVTPTTVPEAAAPAPGDGAASTTSATAAPRGPGGGGGGQESAADVPSNGSGGGSSSSVPVLPVAAVVTVVLGGGALVGRRLLASRGDA